MRKAIRIVSVLLLAYTVIGAIFNIPSAVLMLMDVASYVSDLQVALPTLTMEQADFIIRAYAVAILVENGIALAGMGFLVYYIRNAFNENFKGKKAMLFAIPAFIFAYFPIAIILIIFGAKTLHDPVVAAVDQEPPLE